VTRRAGITKAIGPHTLRHAFINRRPRRRGPPTGCPRSCLPRRPQDHHALRPSPGLPRPARHLHRLHLHRLRQPVDLTPAFWAPPTLDGAHTERRGIADSACDGPTGRESTALMFWSR
jgi:hypothetical protein